MSLMTSSSVRPQFGRSGRGRRQTARQALIAELVTAAGNVRIDEVADRLGVSTMTVHRDLDALVSRGLIRKSRGYVSAAATSLFEASTQYRSGQNPATKRAVADAVLDLVEPGSALLMDDSTTGLHLAERLAERAPLTVVTNFLPVLQTLEGSQDVDLVCLGGQYYPWSESFMGKLTLDALASLRADVFVMSTSAITDDQCFHPTQETVMVKRAMFASASRRILYVDHSKFERRALHALGRLDEFDVLVVDDQVPDERRSHLERLDVELVIAPTGSR
jgi:DeoR/GlpR family transcriptional regulator of sugar metabolism